MKERPLGRKFFVKERPLGRNFFVKERPLGRSKRGLKISCISCINILQFLSLDLVKAILKKTKRNFTGQTLARIAVEVEEEEDVKRLVEAGTVDWNERAREDEDPAIMWALVNDKLSVVHQLLKAPGIDLQVRDSDGWSLLSRAISKRAIGMTIMG